ncbi:MAG: cellulose-binding protein [Catenulispora sp.]|nr:cellulose-binding protein [Catenulispora sp.]
MASRFLRTRALAAALAMAFVAAVSAVALPTAQAATTTCSGTGTIPAGDYMIQANEWNSSAPQCLTYTGGTAWTVSTANFNLSGGAPATYPSIFKGCHWGLCTGNSGMPIQMSKLGSAVSSWNTTQPASGAYDVAYDIWFNSTPTTSGQPDGTEVMIWINSRGGVAPFGSRTGNATISGLNWNVWTGQQTSWKIISYVLNPGATSVSNLDLKAIFQDAQARGSINPAHYLLDVEAGFEIWQGGQGLGTNSFSVTTTTGGGSDTTPPSTPSNLAVAGVSSSSASLSWSPSSDNVGVTGYRVYRNGVQVGTTGGTSFTDSGLSASTQYTYKVAATDAAGNVSAQSAGVTATTSAGGGGGSGCKATYAVTNQWDTGFTANVTVANTGTAPSTGWKVAWTWAGNQQITNVWNGTLAGGGTGSVAVTNAGYNGSIAPGGTTSFGFQGTYSGTNASPTLTCTTS